MSIVIRERKESDLAELIRIWNQVVAAGDAFPQELCLDREEGRLFFQGQSFVGVAEEIESTKIVGLYILHPNNVGRCSHICNASYAVDIGERGKSIGELLVKDSLLQGKSCGFRVLQFNAVVASNIPALQLYQKLGFTQLGVIPGGFRKKDGSYEDICPFYHEL